jgi:hypothetical protein
MLILIPGPCRLLLRGRGDWTEGLTRHTVSWPAPLPASPTCRNPRQLGRQQHLLSSCRAAHFLRLHHQSPIEEAGALTHRVGTTFTVGRCLRDMDVSTLLTTSRQSPIGSWSSCAPSRHNFHNRPMPERHDVSTPLITTSRRSSCAPSRHNFHTRPAGAVLHDVTIAGLQACRLEGWQAPGTGR